MKKLLLVLFALAALAVALRAGADTGEWLRVTTENRDWLYALALAAGIKLLLGHHLD